MQIKNQSFDEDENYDEALLKAERFIEENLHSGMSRMQLLVGAFKILTKGCLSKAKKKSAH